MIATGSINFAGLKKPLRLFFAFIAVSSFVLPIPGQTAKPNGPQKTSPQIPAAQVETPATRTSVDEAFELNIDERRYSQESFDAATAVETKNTADVNLQVGVALASGKIDLLLRNVHGRVRFHGTLGRVLNIINSRQATSPNAPSLSAPVISPD